MVEDPSWFMYVCISVCISVFVPLVCLWYGKRSSHYGARPLLGRKSLTEPSDQTVAITVVSGKPKTQPSLEPLESNAASLLPDAEQGEHSETADVQHVSTPCLNSQEAHLHGDQILPIVPLKVTMASGFTTKDPICLVENQKNQLTVNPKALEILDKISQPVVVVAITGLYRTGKSYLMNRLAGQNHGFPLGSTVKSETKGIWMWCGPHPSKQNCTLVLLDTEGLGDVKKGDSQNDSWIFALAVLLSSMLVYNSLGTINHQALEQLHYVTELTKLIRAKSSPSSGEVDDSAEFVSFFPDFVWAVRDFMLELKLDGRPITEDEYLEDSLKMIPDENPQIEKSNMPQECIRKFFPSRKCFVFDRPTNDKNLLQHLDKVSENELDSIFQKQSKNFCEDIFTQARTKTLREEITVTGNGLGILARTYVDAINSGKVPCLENAVTALAQIENAAAVQKAADHYSEQMAQRVRFPTDTLQELLDLHAACERDAIKVFMEHSFKDDKMEFQEKLLDTIKKKKDDFLLQNEEASSKYCQAQIRQIAKPLLTGISGGNFSKPGGYKLFQEEIDKIVQSYNQVPRKGVKATEVLQSFLLSQEATKESILQADKALTAAEKVLAAEHDKLLEAEKENELLRGKEKEQKEKREAQEKSAKEHAAQLKKKMEKVMHTRLREQEEMLAHKLKEQEKLLKEGFKEKSEEMNKQISHLKEKIEETKRWKLVIEGIGSLLFAALILRMTGNPKTVFALLMNLAR